MRPAAILMLPLLLGAAPPPAGVAAFVRARHLTRYQVALADLDDDGRPEALVYAMATADGDGRADLCGSGGCNLYALRLTADGYRQVASFTVTRPPIRVLRSRSHGWHDLGVFIAGGGVIPGYEARLRFDGRRYPSNPTVAPAAPSHHPPGRVVIAREPLAR